MRFWHSELLVFAANASESGAPLPLGVVDAYAYRPAPFVATSAASRALPELYGSNGTASLAFRAEATGDSIDEFVVLDSGPNVRNASSVTASIFSRGGAWRCNMSIPFKTALGCSLAAVGAGNAMTSAWPDADEFLALYACGAVRAPDAVLLFSANGTLLGNLSVTGLPPLSPDWLPLRDTVTGGVRSRVPLMSAATSGRPVDAWCVALPAAPPEAIPRASAGAGTAVGVTVWCAPRITSQLTLAFTPALELPPASAGTGRRLLVALGDVDVALVAGSDITGVGGGLPGAGGGLWAVLSASSSCSSSSSSSSAETQGSGQSDGASPLLLGGFLFDAVSGLFTPACYVTLPGGEGSGGAGALLSLRQGTAHLVP
jgi:hypothetical protein